MTFFLQGLNNHELVAPGSIFKKAVVEKLDAKAGAHAIDKHEHLGENHNYNHNQQKAVAQKYQSVDQLPQQNSNIFAGQIMSSSVIPLDSDATVNEALALFRSNKIRHLPILSPEGKLVGIVSDRDIFHYLARLEESHALEPQNPREKEISQLMISPVLTASVDTDVRYIARLFVERHVGALPIVAEGKLTGIISRSDVLSAVMRHFELELWA